MTVEQRRIREGAIVKPQYLRVRNWEKFQHYQTRPNPPHWIKMYPALLEDYAFRRLSEIDQARLLKVWLLAARLRNRIPYDARYVAQVIGAKRVDLAMFVELGWLEVMDEEGEIISTPPSTPTSTHGSRRRSDIEERREEREKERAAKAVPVARPQNGLDIANIIDISLQEGTA